MQIVFFMMIELLAPEIYSIMIMAPQSPLQKWAIAVKIRYPPVDDTVKPYGKSVKISKKYFLLSESREKRRK